MLLPILPSCTSCDLHKLSLKHVGVPSLLFSPTFDPARPTIVFCGHQPGFEEDARGESFCGPSGQLLRSVYITPLNLHLACNVVLTNLVRCWPQADKPRPIHIRCCSSHLNADLLSLATSGAGPNYLVLLGGEAVKGVLGVSLSEALRSQGSPSPASIPGDWSVFSTFHPAFLLSRRNPNAIRAVQDHLQLLLDRLHGQPVRRSRPLIVPPGPPPRPSHAL